MAWGQEESATLRYRFEAGQVQHYEVAIETTVTTKVENSAQESKNQSSSIKALKVVAIDTNGIATIESMVTRVVLKSTLPGGAVVQFDSAQADPTPLQFRPVAESIGKVSSRLKVSPMGQVLEAVSINPDGTPEAVPPPSAPKRTPRHDVLMNLPESPVTRGSTWKQSYPVILYGAENQPKEVQMVRVFKVLDIVPQGPAGKFVTISHSTEPAEPPTDPEIASRLAPYLVAGELVFDTGRGLVPSFISQMNREYAEASGPGTSLGISTFSLEQMVPPNAEPGLARFLEKASPALDPAN
jgi:hypothetical protein